MTTEKPPHSSTIKLLALVEATNVNAVAKNMLEFCRSAREARQQLPRSPFIETSFVTFERGAAETSNEFVTAAREAGLEIDVIRESGRFDMRVLSALREIVKERAPDIVLTHQVKSHFLFKLSGLWRRYPWVAFNHGYTTTDLKVRAYNYLDRWSLPTATRVITVCEAFAQKLVSAGVRPERINVQHNSIRPEEAASTEEVKELRNRFAVADDEKIVLAIGRLSGEKAHVDLLAACKHLREIEPQLKARFIIVGDGPERGRLEAAVASLGLNERVLLAGQSSNVQPYYAAADVLALPSHSEGSPYVLLEAMAAGLPIVATSVGGVPEMVEDGVSALLVPARDSRALASAIARVLTDTDIARRLSENASALAATRYSPETYFCSLSEIYRGIICGGEAADLRAVRPDLNS